MLSAKLTERLSPNSENLRRCAPLGSPERGAVSAQPRLRGCRRSAGKDPNRKFSLRFGKEETSTEEKRRRLRRLVPSWSFLTCLRRPYLFRRKRKDRGEKSAWTRLALSASEFRWALVFRCRSTRWSPYGRLGTRRLIRGTRFVGSCVWMSAVNGRCGRNLLGLDLFAGEVRGTFCI